MNYLRRRRIVFSIVLPLLYLFLLLRLWDIQVWRRERLLQKAKEIHLRRYRILPRRGEIVDRNEFPLAFDLPRYSVFYRRTKENVPEAKLKKLASFLGEPYERLEDLFIRRKFVYLLRNVDENILQGIKEIGIPGVEWEEEFQRYYPTGSLLAPLLGFVGRDRKGLRGIEYFYDSYLQGIKGVGVALRDGKGRLLPSSRRYLQTPRPGYRLVLTLDYRYQYILAEELKKAHERYQARRSVGILMNPNTGEILAMVSFPTFDPGNFQDFSPESYKNLAIEFVYEPGSTFKVITLSAALEEKVVKPEEKIFCEWGSFSLYGHVIHDHEKYGWLTVEDTLVFSSNIGLTKIGMRLGEEKLYQYIKKFGFGSPTGIDLPGEEKGILRPLSQWSGISIGAIPYGQEVGVTPLQLAVAVSAVINGGELLKPFVVKKILDDRGKEVYKRGREVIRRVISPSTSLLMRKIMREVVRRGTGVRARIEGFEVGGKTGTAQKYEPGKGYQSGKYTASFIGFLPVDKPRFLLLVVVDEPQGGHYGGEIAAPVFRRVMEKILCYETLPPGKLVMK